MGIRAQRGRHTHMLGMGQQEECSRASCPICLQASCCLSFPSLRLALPSIHHGCCRNLVLQLSHSRKHSHLPGDPHQKQTQKNLPPLGPAPPSSKSPYVRHSQLSTKQQLPGPLTWGPPSLCLAAGLPLRGTPAGLMLPFSAPRNPSP